MEQYFNVTHTDMKSAKTKRNRVLFFIFCAIGVYFYAIFFIPPKNFPQHTTVIVKQGTTITGISKELESKGYIKNDRIFSILFVALGDDRTLASGDYVFDTPLHMWNIVHRFRNHEYGNSRLKITIPEGMNRYEMANILDNTIPSFNTTLFLELSKNDEGYLFPDTYYFFSTVSPSEVIDTVKKNFETKVESLTADIEASGKTEKDIIIMASIIEKEARGDDDRNIVSGILWKRIRIGMPLQVDATFLYLLGKTSQQLTIVDLNTDSPYNTYTNKGLPPGPITNPGIESIKAALYPEDSPYLYYLHDRYGTIHYAKNFEEHKANKSRYLQN
ncbi:MAG: endolytic transglycosylase MltG [Candidatus Pacebacteria bacterium]|nr:endolytic transglycosylase MltG [Candidatus Paceibacterota bacterium]